MAAREKNRQFPTAYKLKAINVSSEAKAFYLWLREIGISRKILHDWI